MVLVRANDSFSLSNSKHQRPDNGHRALSTERRSLGTGTRQRHPTPSDTTTGHQHLTPPAGTTTGHHHPAPSPDTTTRSPCSETFRMPEHASGPCHHLKHAQYLPTFRRCAVFRVFRPPSEGGRSSIAWVDLLHNRSAVRYRGSRRRAPSPPSSLIAAHRTRVQNALPENVYIFLSG